MAKHKKRWDEGEFNLFSDEYKKRVEILEQRINEVEQEKNDGLQHQSTLGRSSDRSDDNTDQMERVERDAVERDLQGDRAQLLSQPRGDGFLSFDDTLPDDDHSKMVQAATDNGDGRGDQTKRGGRNRNGGIRSRGTGTESLFDAIGQTAERERLHGYRDTNSNGSGSLPGLLGDTIGQSEISIQTRIRQAESIHTKRIVSTGINLDFVAKDEVLFKGKKDKFNKNIQAIKLLKELNKIEEQAIKDNNDFTITKEEQEILNQFGGWGNLPEVFDYRNDEWQKERETLRNLLNDKEFKNAAASATSAFYTPEFIIDTIYKSLDRMGLNRNDQRKSILEPSAGNGAFLARASKYLKSYHFTTIEKDEISHGLLKKLYPNQQNLIRGFETYDPKDKKFDAIIGNPPYGEARLSDISNTDLTGISIHNFFAAKAPLLLKDKGIMAFVISSHFMDNKNSEMREYIADKSTFLGAIRLPETAFKNAGTQAATDIVFFQKGIDKKINQEWLKSEKHDSGFNINEYFLKNPQNVLGDLSVRMSNHGEILTCKEDPNINLEQKLNGFIQTLPKDIYEYQEIRTEDNILEIDLTNQEYANDRAYFDELKVSNYLKFGNGFFIKKQSFEPGILILERQELSKLDAKRVDIFIKMRDTHKTLINLEKTQIGDNDPELMAIRTKLNTLYDEYHSNGDFLHNSRKSGVLSKDVDFQKIKALEANYQKAISAKEALAKDIEPKNESASKAHILEQRVIRPNPMISFDNPIDGLYISMNLYGRVNIDFIAQKLNSSKEEIANSLLDDKRIFLDPIQYEKGVTQYLLAEQYLSGDIKAKFKEAAEIAKTYPQINKNMDALKASFPPDIKPTDIETPMGSAWIPLKYYNDFFEKELGIKRNNWNLSRSSLTGAWNFKGSDHGITAYNKKRFSTENKDVFEIGEAALSNSSIKIMKETDIPELDREGNPKFDKSGRQIFKKIVDLEKTRAANQKVEYMREVFAEWVMKDYDRRMDLAQIYNEKFNCYIKKSYDGERINLDGLNEGYTLRKHQKDAIFRAVNERNCLFDHEVGAGKTLTSICSIMKQRELGIINKPLIAVPNHLILQWENEFMNAFPNANLLVADEKSLSMGRENRQKREEFFGQIMNGNYDAIIITHSQLDKIPVPLEVSSKVLERELAELQESIRLKEEDENATRTSLKQMQTRLQNLENKLNTLRDEKSKSKMLDFSDLGIDCLVVDESHMFKNLSFTTALDVKGLGNQAGSKKALSLYEKTTFLNDNDKKVIFLTGTPISNSLSELYTISKYLMPRELEQKGIDAFDAWASTFAGIENVPELDATAQKYKIVSRFVSLNNLPELCGMYSNTADIVTNTDIKKYYKNYVPGIEIKKEVSPASKAIQEYIGVQDPLTGRFNEGSIIDRMENMPEDKSIDNHLKCTSDAKKAGIDFRLIDKNAPDYENSKINKCVKNIIDEYHAWGKDKGTQLVFLDIGTPKGANQLSTNIKIDDESVAIKQPSMDEFRNINDIIDSEEDIDTEQEADKFSDEETFFLYGDLYKKLVKAGIPRNEIAFIHDTNGSNAKKLELFQKVNSGDVRILIGSTAKMGAGTNVQERVTAIHHLDVPWRPSDFVQRNGRVIRQGNQLFARDPENFKIKEFRYLTEKTYDAVSWQIIETKTSSLINFRKGLVDGRTLSGFEEEAASAAEMKAAATGNPLLITQVKLKSELDKEEMLFKNFKKEYQQCEENIIANTKLIEHYQKDITKLQNTLLAVQNNQNENFDCDIILNNFSSVSMKEHFNIPKSKEYGDPLENEKIKSDQESMARMFKENINLIFSGSSSYDVLEYKGFVVSGYYDDTMRSVVFELTNKDTGEVSYPANLTYTNSDKNSLFKDQIKPTGFFTRLNNYLKEENIQKLIEQRKTDIQGLHKTNDSLEEYLQSNQQYPKMMQLELLRSDNKILMEELEKMSKDPGYKSMFNPQSLAQIEESKNNKRAAYPAQIQKLSQEPIQSNTYYNR